MLPKKLETGKGALCAFRLITARNYAAAAAAQPKRVPPTDRPFLPAPAGLKFTRLSNGLFLATVDNRNPVARISIVFKAGTRYETTETRGIVHRVRNLVGLSTSSQSSIKFNYGLANLGCILSSSATRDHLSIDIQIPRNYAGEAFHILNDLFAEPFHANSRELEFSTNQMWYEKNQLKENWPAYALEKLHKVAYREQGLANSLLSPKYAIGKYKASDVQQFAQQYFVTGNAALVATGVDHEEALKFASNRFVLTKGSAVPLPPSKKFFSGEVRKQRGGTDLAVVHIAGGSAGLSDVKGTIALAVLANLLGTGPSVKWSEGGQSRLAKAAAKATSNPVQVTATNIGYEDSGIFGLCYISQWQDSGVVAKAAVNEMRSVATSGLNDTELQAAKNKLKCRLLSLAENDDYVTEDMGVQAAVRQADLHTALDQAKLIDSITVADVQQAAKQLVGSKFSISAVGRLDKTPYTDELVG